MVVNGAETPLDTVQQATLTLNNANGELTIQNSDAGLEGTSWTVRVSMESTQSLQGNARATYTFDVTFTNVCTLDSITTAQPSTTGIADVEYSIGRTGPVVIQP
jgi:hypothetical protein